MASIAQSLLDRLPWRRADGAAKKQGLVRTPVVLQIEALECGAAALSIVMRHYGLYVSLEELRQRCGVTRDGSKASNVLKAARGYGMVAKGYKKEPADLRDMTFPVIVFWNFNHFLVVEGFDEDKVYINDPAWGRRVVSSAEFDQSFTGVVLSVQPGPEFKPNGGDDSLFRGAFRRLTGDYGALAFVMAAGLFMVVPGMVMPVITEVFVDRVLVSGQQSWLWPLLGGFAFAALLQGLLKWLQDWYLLRLQTKLVLTMASKFFWHLLHLPHVFFTQRAPGEIGWRLMLNDSIATVITGDLARAVVNGVLSILFFAIMMTYSVTLALLALLVVVVNLLVFRLVAQRTQEASLGKSIAQGKLQGTAAGGLSVIETLRATASESAFFGKFGGFLAQYIEAQQRSEALGIAYRQGPAFLLLTTEVMILCFGGTRVMEGQMTLGMLVAFQGLTFNFVNPAMQLVGLMDSVQHLRGDMQRIDDVLNYKRDPTVDRLALYDPADMDAAARKLSGHLELRDVSFGYNPHDKPLLSGFSMTLAPGERVAIVGRSGCGKSTVAKLITGLYAPWSGDILFDGQPRDAYSRMRLANSLAMVDQDVVLFEGSFRDNLTLWDTSIPEAEILSAAKDALVHEFIMARPLGYDGLVSEGGRNMSGGQRQRLEIARALAGNPRILVLDEATSALDTTTEEELESNLRRRGCSCVIIAHRLSTIRDCDRILVLDEGHLVEQGSHDDLMAMPDGHYRRLLEEA